MMRSREEEIARVQTQTLEQTRAAQVATVEAVRIWAAAQQMPASRPKPQFRWGVTIEDQRKAVDAAYLFMQRLLELRRDFDHKVSALMWAGGSRAAGAHPTLHLPLPEFVPSEVSMPSSGADQVAAEEGAPLRTTQAAESATAEAETQASAVTQQAAASESATVQTSAKKPETEQEGRAKGRPVKKTAAAAVKKTTPVVTKTAPVVKNAPAKSSPARRKPAAASTTAKRDGRGPSSRQGRH